jgi:hypothetical protein
MIDTQSYPGAWAEQIAMGAVVPVEYEPSVSQAAAILSRHRVQNERQRVRDKARAMNVAMGRDIPEILR